LDEPGLPPHLFRFAEGLEPGVDLVRQGAGGETGSVALDVDMPSKVRAPFA